MTGRRIFLIVALVLSLSSTAGAASLPVIIQVSPLGNITGIVNALGATVVDSIPGANTYLLNVPLVPPQFTLALLGITSIEVNLGVSLPGIVPPAPLGFGNPLLNPAEWYKTQPSWERIHAGSALTYSRGYGVTVADINSRVDTTHPALQTHMIGGYDFVANRPTGSTALNQSEAGFLDDSGGVLLNQSEAGFLDQSTAWFLDNSEAGFLDGPNPALSHGTLCAGIIAAIAPDSPIMPLRAFDDEGRGDIFNIAKAIRFAVDHGAQVINMSFGTLVPSNALKNAVKYAQNANVIVVASAGNNNTSTAQYPAAYSGVLTTAATDILDRKASFSNYGSAVFVSAPGVNIISTLPGGYYAMVSGTSFSAPAVAGTAALVRYLHATGVSSAISSGAVNINGSNPAYVNKLGYGRIDVLRSVDPN